MADKRTGVDVHGGHCFGLIDDKIAAGSSVQPALQRTLILLFDIIEIEDWLTPGVMFRSRPHFRNVLSGKFQRAVGEARVHADSVELSISKIT